MSFTIESTTEWVCADCHLVIGGFGEHEIGHKVAMPYEHDETVTDVQSGTSPWECEVAKFGDHATDDYELHSECDRDSAYLGGCDACGRFQGEYMNAYAVVVSRMVEYPGLESRPDGRTEAVRN